MTNPYAAYATTATDIAGVEHIVWQSDGRLYHAVYDANLGGWGQAEQISNTVGGTNVQLTAGNLYPYLKNPNNPQELGYAPGLMAVWEHGVGNDRNVYVVVGRYNAKGEVIWSDQVALTKDGIADQNIDSTLVEPGVVDIVYQKGIVQDPRDARYLADPTQMWEDLNSPNRDDTDLYHTAVRLVLEGPDQTPSLKIFDQANIPLIFKDPTPDTAIYYSLGPGAQGVSALVEESQGDRQTPSADPTFAAVNSNSGFPAGVNRGFRIVLGNPFKAVDGRIGIPGLEKVNNFGLELSGSLGLNRDQSALKAQMLLSVSDYEKEDEKKQPIPKTGLTGSGSLRTGSARKGGLFDLPIAAISLNFKGELNYSPLEHKLVGRKRVTDFNIRLWRQLKLNIGTDDFSLGQFRAEGDLDLAFKASTRLAGAKPGTQASFILNPWHPAIPALAGVNLGVSALASVAQTTKKPINTNIGAGLQIVGALATLGSDLPIIIGAAQIVLPPWPSSSDSDKYTRSSVGLGGAVGVTLTGFVGFLNQTFVAQGITSSQIGVLVDTKTGAFQFPWFFNIQLGAQLGTYTWRYTWVDLSGVIQTGGFQATNEPVEAETPDNGKVLFGYNPYQGTLNSYETPTSRPVQGSSGEARVEGLSDNYQINFVSLLNGGSNYLNGQSGSFQVSIPGSLTGNDALANVVVTKGVITNITVFDQGGGYGDRPLTIDFNITGGTGATGTVTLDEAGSITAVTITNGGQGYLGGKSGFLAITPLGAAEKPARLSVEVTEGKITKALIFDQGLGYQAGQVSLDFSRNGGGGQGAQAEAQPINSSVGSVVNDGRPSLNSLTYSTNGVEQRSTALAWIADGVDDITPLTDRERNGSVTTRVQTAMWQGDRWGNVETLPGEGSTGFNFDPAVGQWLNPTGDPMGLVVWSHARADSLSPESTSQEITDIVLQTDVYYAIKNAGQPGWTTPKLLTNSPGTDTRLVLGPGANPNQLILAWVNTSLPDPTTGNATQSLKVAFWDGFNFRFSEPQTLVTISTENGKGLEGIHIGQYQGQSAVFWSNSTEPGYAYGVLESSPSFYFRLDEQQNDPAALNSVRTDGVGSAFYVGNLKYGQPGALQTANNQGDPNPSVGFTGNGYVYLPSVISDSALGDLSLELWVNGDNLNSGQSLIDQGLYNSQAVLPTGTVNLTILKTPVQDETGQWGYVYGVVISPETRFQVTNGGAGLSPFNLQLDRLLAGTDLQVANGVTITLDITPVLELEVSDQGRLNKISVPNANQILGTKFVADTSAATAQVSQSFLQAPLAFQQIPGWSLRTGENKTLIFNPGGETVSSVPLNPGQWYYVVATYDADRQTASLYVDGNLVGQTQTGRSPLVDLPVLLGNKFQGRLDEVAIYDKLITKNTSSGIVDSQNQLTSLLLAGGGEITDHYQNRFSAPQAVEEAAFYRVYDGQTWQSPTQFTTDVQLTPTNPILRRSPAVDIASANFNLLPDGRTDNRVAIRLSPAILDPGSKVVGIEIRASGGLRWTVGDYGNNPGWSVGVVADGKLINPLTPGQPFSYRMMSVNATLDLYFQYTNSLGIGENVTVLLTVEKGDGSRSTLPPLLTTVIPNPSSTLGEVTEAGKEALALGTILENEVTNLNQVDSGVVFEVPRSPGQVVAAGTFLNGKMAIALSQPNSLNDAQGRIWVLPVGSSENLNRLKLADLSDTQAPQDGVLIRLNGVTLLGSALSVGDINGDRIDDLVIGAPGADNGAGRVYVVSGSKLMPGQILDLKPENSVMIQGREGSQAGTSVAVGDVNGDGKDDVVVGAPYDGFDGKSVGAVYVLTGSSSFFNESLRSLGENNLLMRGDSGSYLDDYLETQTWTSNLGFSVAVSRAQNNSVDGDQFADIIIGAPNYRQDVRFGGDGVRNGVAPALVAEYDRLLTTYPNEPNNGDYTLNLNTGRAYIIFGDAQIPKNLWESQLDGTNGVILDGSPLRAGDSATGTVVATGGDLSGDGLDDVAISAPEGLDTTGLVFLLKGLSKEKKEYFEKQYVLSTAANAAIGGSSTGAKAGLNLNLRGDLNKDNHDDLFIASPQAGYATGEGHLVLGSETLLSGTIPQYWSLQAGAGEGTIVFNGNKPGGLATESVWSGTDLDGDGAEDLLLNSPFEGQIYAVLGSKPGLVPESQIKLNSLASNQGQVLNQIGGGNQVANVGDINGDGFADALLSRANSVATVVFGGSNQTLLDESIGTQNLNLTPVLGRDLNIVRGVGDFNGDGLSDLLTLNTSNTLPLSNPNLRLATFQNNLFAIWNGDSQGVYVSRSLDAQTWETPTRLNWPVGDTTPSLVVFKDKLYAFFAYNGMAYSVYENGQWSAPAPTGPGMGTSSGVSLAVYNNTLFAIWKGIAGDPALYYSTSTDGINWTEQRWLSGSAIWGEQVPTLVVYADSFSFPRQPKLFAYWYSPQSDQERGVFRYATWQPENNSWSSPQINYGLTPNAPLPTQGGLSIVENNGSLQAWTTIPPVPGLPPLLHLATSRDGINWSGLTPWKGFSSQVQSSGPVTLAGMPGLAQFNSQVQIVSALASDNAVIGAQNFVFDTDNTSLFNLTTPKQSLTLLAGQAALGITGDLNLSSEKAVLTQQTFTDMVGVGDLNGDGFGDVVLRQRLGQPFVPPDPTEPLPFYVLFGNNQQFLVPQELKIQDLTVTGQFQISGIGDMNGDGFNDLALSNPSLNQYNGGFYLLLGGSAFKEQVNQGVPLPVQAYPASPFVPSTPSWETPKTLNVIPDFDRRDGAMSTSVFNGEVVALWRTATNHSDGRSNIGFSRATSSINWKNSAFLSIPAGTLVPPVLVSFLGKLYAYWYGTIPGIGSKLLSKAYQGNGSWSEVTVPTSLTPSSIGGGFDIREYNGELYAVWTIVGSINDVAKPLYFSKSSDGINWTAPEVISSTDVYASQTYIPRLVVFQGKLSVYYADPNRIRLAASELDNSLLAEQSTIYSVTYDEINQRWGSPRSTNLTSGNKGVNNKGLSVVNVIDQTLFASWTSGTDILQASSKDGLSWSEPTLLQGTYGWGLPALYVLGDRLELVSPGVTDSRELSTSRFTTTATSEKIFQSGAVGEVITRAGDANGDGFADTLILAPDFPQTDGRKGAVLLRFGGPEGLGGSQVILSGVNLPRGTRLASAGDINGDGFDDILIGNSGANSASGIVYVVFGAPHLEDLKSIDLSQLQPVAANGAGASAPIGNGKLVSVALKSGGQGYLGGRSGTFNILASSPTSTQQAVIRADVVNGRIETVEITNPGAGFTNTSNISFDYRLGNGGTGAELLAKDLVSLAGFQIVGLPNSLAGGDLGGGQDTNGDGLDDLVLGAPGRGVDVDALGYLLFGGDFRGNVNQYGSIGDDVLQGTPTGEALLGQSGDDILLGQGGKDVLLGGTGDDWLEVSDPNFQRVDGGSGFDTLALQGYLNQPWNLTTLAPGLRIQDVEGINIQGYGSNLLTLNKVTVLNLSSTSNQVFVVGDSGDRLDLGANFKANGTQYLGGSNFAIYRDGEAEVWIATQIPLENISFTAPAVNQPLRLPELDPPPLPTLSFSLETLEGPTLPQESQFYVTSPIVGENDGVIPFTITRTGDLSQPAAVRYRTINDTAHAGIHYHGEIGYVTFAPGETTTEVSITLIDDENIGPRQRQLSLGLTPLSNTQAELLTERQITFTPQTGSQLRNLETLTLDPNLALSLESSLPFESNSFNVSAPDGAATLNFSVTGVNTPNTYFRWNQENNRFEEFLFDGETGLEFLDTSLDGSIDTFKLHLVDGGRGDSDGVVNGVITGRSVIGQTTPGPVQVSPGVFYIPTSSDGQLQFQNLTASGNYEMGVILVDDATGRIGTLQPGDDGYTEVALARKQSIFNQAPGSDLQALTTNQAKQALSNPQLLVQSEFEAVGSFMGQQLAGNQYYALYLNQNGETQFSVGNEQFQAHQDGRGLTQVSWGSNRFEVGTPLLVTPGSPGQQFQASFELARGGAYDNTLALYKVDNLTGELDLNRDGVMDLKPGDVGYSQAALERVQNSQTGLVLPKVEQIFTSRSTTVTLDGGTLYGMVLIPNASVAELLATNPGNSADKAIHGFFSFGEVNPGGNSHIRRLGQNLWGFEDLPGGGDRDYNDMVLGVSLQL